MLMKGDNYEFRRVQTGLSSSILSSWFSGRLNLKEHEIEIIQRYMQEKEM